MAPWRLGVADERLCARSTPSLAEVIRLGGVRRSAASRNPAPHGRMGDDGLRSGTPQGGPREGANNRDGAPIWGEMSVELYERLQRNRAEYERAVTLDFPGAFAHEDAEDLVSE